MLNKKTNSLNPSPYTTNIQTSYDRMSRKKYFEKLVKAYSNDLYRFAYWLSSNHSIADDLLQETFLRAWKALDKLEDRKKAKSWLITILRRENARRFERKRFDLVDIEDVVVEDTINPRPELSIENQQLHKAILNLDAQYREPLLLHSIGGYKSREIAHKLRLNLNTVNTRLFRARQQLKGQLSKDLLYSYN